MAKRKEIVRHAPLIAANGLRMDCVFIGDPVEAIQLVLRGVTIAQRHDNKQWIAIEPGYAVYDDGASPPGTITVMFNGAVVH